MILYLFLFVLKFFEALLFFVGFSGNSSSSISYHRNKIEAKIILQIQFGPADPRYVLAYPRSKRTNSHKIAVTLPRYFYPENQLLQDSLVSMGFSSKNFGLYLNNQLFFLSNNDKIFSVLRSILPIRSISYSQK